MGDAEVPVGCRELVEVGADDGQVMFALGVTEHSVEVGRGLATIPRTASARDARNGSPASTRELERRFAPQHARDPSPSTESSHP